jgi:hypothetical protein
MTTALDIITRGFRESNTIPLGQTPNANLEAEAFAKLKSLISSAYGNEVGEKLADWPVGLGNYTETLPYWSSGQWQYPRPNSRLLLNLTESTTLYLPHNPQDGARLAVVDNGNNLATYNLTLDGNGRRIEGANSVTLSTDGLLRSWMFRADLGQWVVLTALGATSEDMPFPEEFDDYFITKLAMRINPVYGRSLSEESKMHLSDMLSQLQARYTQRVNMPCDRGAIQMNTRTPGRPIDPYNPPFGY